MQDTKYKIQHIPNTQDKDTRYKTQDTKYTSYKIYKLQNIQDTKYKIQHTKYTRTR